MNGRIASQIAVALLLGVATFIAVWVCLAYLEDGSRAVGFWLANGIPLAALLRTPRRRWPFLVLCAFLGNMIAGIAFRPTGTLPFTIISCIGNVLQYGIVAIALRARFGAYFDLLKARQVIWLCWLSIPATMVKGALQILGALMTGHAVLVPGYSLAWFFSTLLGLFVLSLPLLAISSTRTERDSRFDGLGYALIALLLALVFVSFGPFSFQALYLILPPLMLLAWRYGLFGAGLGSLLTTILGSFLAITTDGITLRLMNAGYAANEIGIYLEFFYNVATLTSLPVAVARTRQKATDAALATALSSAERRATELADREAVIRRSQAILRLSEQRFRTIVEKAPLGIALVDSDTHVFLDANPKFLEIAGWPRAKLLRKTWQEITHPDHLEAELEHAAPFLTGDVPDLQIEKSYLRADGTPVWVNLTVARVAMPGTDRERFLVMIEDVTERKALQQQLDVVQRLDAVGQLTGGIAHDFNNLLTVIIGSSETLAEDLTDPDQRELAGLILDTAERAGELTRHLLAFARRQPLSPRPLDINRLLDKTEPLIRRTLGANLRFSISKASHVRTVFADRGQIEAAILNLCLNARDAMPNGGRLTIRTENAVFDEEFVRHHSGARPGQFVAVRVSDTGTGIAPDIVDRIFEPFFTTKEAGHGTGLGLSMVYGFIKQSQGYVEVETEVGKGTVISLYLPIADGSADTASPARKATVPGGAETILLVEDDDLVRAHARTQLDSLGYRIIEAEDGPSAMALIEKRDDIALLFTDVMMPGGMNGRELAEKATSLRHGLRVLFTSGYSNEMLMENGRLIDGVALLPKPYSKRQLAEKIREALDAPT